MQGAILADRSSRIEARRTFVAFLSLMALSLLLGRPEETPGAAAREVALICGLALFLTVIDFETGIGMRSAAREIVHAPAVVLRVVFFAVGVAWGIWHTRAGVPPIKMGTLADIVVAWLLAASILAWRLVRIAAMAKLRSDQPKR